MQPPRKLQNSRTTGQLVIQWAAGIEHKIAYRQLRSACRCASCRADQTRGKISLIPDDLYVVKINNLGQGLQLVFSDGHERGIFPWQYLHDIGEQCVGQ
ncbi:MAG: DUF971 domain-containing protein [Gammaproteobacteria bacterium]|nr:MAG: DUF971 domain-containing protein [Gammaproteobacteria bacterium]